MFGSTQPRWTLFPTGLTTSTTCTTSSPSSVGRPNPRVSRSHAGCTVRGWKTPSRFQRFLSRSLVLRWRWSLISQTHLCIPCLIWRYSVLLGVSHLKVQCVIISGLCLTFWRYSTVCAWMSQKSYTLFIVNILSLLIGQKSRNSGCDWFI